MTPAAMRSLLLLFLAACGSSESTNDASTPDAAMTSDANVQKDSAVAMDAGADVTTMDGTSNTCIDNTSPGQHTYTCDGIKYDVMIPPSCSSGCGLVLDVHGFTMNAAMEDANTNMRALGAQYKYVVVQPNANPAPPQSSWTPLTDDPKVFGFLQLAMQTFAIDKKRVHMTGFSQGGMMTFRFLCAHADVFASVAPGAGTGCTFTTNDKPSREIPVLYMHGTKDALVSFTGAGLPQRNAVIAGWNMSQGQVIASDSTYARTRYTSPKGTVLEFIQHDYTAATFVLSGHCYPGSTDPGNVPGQVFPFKCIGQNSFTWGEEVMKFFVAHPAP